MNELSEAVSLLKMVSDRDFSDLHTRPNVYNCMAVHRQLVMHGVRFRDESFACKPVIHHAEVDATPELLDIQKARTEGEKMRSRISVALARVKAKLPLLKRKVQEAQEPPRSKRFYARKSYRNLM